MASGRVPFDGARLDDRGSRPSTVPAWQAALRHDLGRLRSARRRVIARFDATRQLATPHDEGTAQSWDRYVATQIRNLTDEAVIGSLGDTLDQAVALLDASAKAHPLRRMVQAGAVQEAVLGCLSRGREALYLVEDDAWVAAQLTPLRAGVVSCLGSGDPRAEAFLRRLDDLQRSPAEGGRFATSTRETLRAVQCAVDDARLAAQGAVRAFRNAVLAATGLLTLAAIALPALAGSFDPPTPFTMSALAGVEAWGLLGGLVAVVAGLRHLRSFRHPGGLQLARLVLKLPAGALTALFGVLLLQGGILPQLPPAAAGQVPAYAVLLGFAQEGLTRFVDRRANTVLENAKPLGDRAA